MSEQEPSGEFLGDEYLIMLGIEQAASHERIIDDATARRIAMQLHTGQGSGLYSFGSSGAIEHDVIGPEVAFGWSVSKVDQEPIQALWYDRLALYLQEHHEDRGPVEGWQRLTQDGRPLGNIEDLEPLDPEQEARKQRIDVWVGDTAAYAAGALNGEWIDAARDADELHDAVGRLLQNSPEPGADRYGIYDQMGFEDIKLGTQMSLERVAKIARAIDTHGVPMALWIEHQGYGTDDEIDRAVTRFETAYLGYFETEAKFLDMLQEESGHDTIEEAIREHLPPELTDYLSFDVKAWYRDKQARGEIHVLRRRGQRGIYAFLS